MVVAIWLVINVVSYALLVFRGEEVALGLPASPTNGLPVGAPASQVVGMAVTLWIFVGIAEDLVARAYMQNELIALIGGLDVSQLPLNLLPTRFGEHSICSPRLN